MRTSLCDVLGIDVPVICAPFGPWDEVALAAAVCEAGGLGSLGTAVRPLEELRGQWARLRERTSRPFAINHQTRPFDEATFAASLEAHPAVISFHMGDPGELVDRAHRAGSLWMQQVMDVAQARCAVERGVDVIIAQGAEAGGHSGFVSTLVLVPQVVDVAGSIPVVAAGGIADGRGLAAALALGAQGVAMGTRFLASTEMAISADWKRMLVAADAIDSVKAEYLDAILPPYTRPAYPAVCRVLRTPFHDQWSGHAVELAHEAERLAPELVGAILAGEGHQYVPFAGQSVGLVRDVLPAAEIVRRVVDEADRILRACL
jgi:nitronate monooxygenase/enoyl-[acyl-carrier protein] reductase II